jgi:hypothetical protein
MGYGEKNHLNRLGAGGSQWSIRRWCRRSIDCIEDRSAPEWRRRTSVGVGSDQHPKVPKLFLGHSPVTVWWTHRVLLLQSKWRSQLLVGTDIIADAMKVWWIDQTHGGWIARVQGKGILVACDHGSEHLHCQVRDEMHQMTWSWYSYMAWVDASTISNEGWPLPWPLLDGFQQ